MGAIVTIKINQSELRGLVQDPAGGVYRDLNRRLNRVRTQAKRLAPVDLGILRGSIDQEIQKQKGTIVGRVGTNVEYAIYQELGTRYMRAQPFLVPALRKAK